MPQILMAIAPNVRGLLPEEVLEGVGSGLIPIVESVFDLEGEEDVTFTAVYAACVLNDADVQTEVRYTAGTDEYGRGVFEPTEEKMEILASSLMRALKCFLPKQVASLSVWVMPFKGTAFKYENLP